MNELDLTQGKIPKVLLKFALPFLAANALQALYGGADLFVVGRYDDASSVAGVAIGSQVMQTITGIILGLTTGTTILIAMATGAKDDKKTANTIGTSIYFFALAAIILTSTMILLHEHIAEIMHTPEEAMTDTLHYILICSAGIPFIMGYNVACGILRGLGDSQSPLYFVALACVINIGFDFLLVGGFGMRAAGAAIATIFSQGVSFLAALWFLHRRGFIIKTHRHVRRTHCTARCPHKHFVLDNNSHCQPDGSHSLCRIRRSGKNHSICHAASNGRGSCRSDNDSSKLWSTADVAHDRLPALGHCDVVGFRIIVLSVFTILARFAYRDFHRRHCSSGNGSRIPARI